MRNILRFILFYHFPPRRRSAKREARSAKREGEARSAKGEGAGFFIKILPMAMGSQNCI